MTAEDRAALEAVAEQIQAADEMRLTLPGQSGAIDREGQVLAVLLTRFDGRSWVCHSEAVLR